MPEPSIYTKIINREVPGYFLYEDDICVAILDLFPTVKGQSLVIPKKQIAYAFDLDDQTYNHIFTVAKKIALASDKALGAEKSCLVVEGFQVPHVHLKVFPMLPGHGDLSEYVRPGEQANEEELKVLATQIQAALEE